LGQSLEIEVSGIPAKVFPAVITFVEPALNDVTRTVKVRADIRNPMVEVNGSPQRLLKFGMYAEGKVRAENMQVLAIARSAILFPGGDAYAYVEVDGGTYERRRLKLGRQGDELWEVLEGVKEGDKVVISGNTLLDAQAQFNRADNSEIAAAAPVAPAEPQASPVHCGEGPSSTAAPARPTEVMPIATGPRPRVSTATRTNVMPVAPLREHAAAKRTQLMSAIMSPGAELQMRRRATILAQLEQSAATNNIPITGVHVEPGLADVMAGEADTSTETRRLSMAMTAGQKPTEPMAVAAVLLAQGRNPDTIPLSPLQCQQVQDLLLEVNAISGALAADDLAQYQAHAARLPAVLAPVQKELAHRLHWETLLVPLAGLNQGEPPQNLDQARRRFLPFSTGAVELVKRVRRDVPGFPKVMIYHCPMAPKPGLWMQAQGPLRNPFYGSAMLKCGEEVN
jgi:hypothetical protein